MRNVRGWMFVCNLVKVCYAPGPLKGIFTPYVPSPFLADPEFRGIWQFFTMTQIPFTVWIVSVVIANPRILDRRVIMHHTWQLYLPTSNSVAVEVVNHEVTADPSACYTAMSDHI